ncbi:MAG: porphobilinogen synthase [Candidatus Omnitrophica bacterium]|nr:porphobilinogen synthase [Candidatus Omnitrophota bacterium]
MKFPEARPRRLRENPVLRKLVSETKLSLDHLVMPYFVRAMKEEKKPIPALPGLYHYSVEGLLREVGQLMKSGVHSILLFGVPGKTDLAASEAYARNGIVQKAVRALKKEFPSLLVITDVCLCAYMSHGHCGVVEKGRVSNDPSLKLLARVAVSHAESGADVAAPSDMMDGRVRAIRRALDSRGFESLPILSYAAKYASSFYGPFRDAAGSTPQFSDRKSYQMNYANCQEAMKEIAFDLEEGADMVMVKPALAYLDVIAFARRRFSVPIAAYNVSGEYAMIRACGGLPFFSEKEMVLEILTAMRRAGAQIIITYHARQLAAWNHREKVL